jgi:hypothetical protein
MLWLPVESTMAAIISLCANLKELELVEQSFKQNATTSINKKSSLLRCGQEKHASGKTGLTIDTNGVLHAQDIPAPLPQYTEHTAISDWLSNLQCNDLLCKISYTTLVFSNAVSITQNDQINISFLNTGFVSHVPEQSYRPPIG